MPPSGRDHRLELTLHRLNTLRLSGPARIRVRVEARLEQRYGCSARLAVYGSLAPGRAHHDVVADLRGRWSDGVVRGVLYDRGWASGSGYPGLVWNPAGPAVAVKLFDSPDLARSWDRLDAFEGPDYLRILATVHLPGGGITVANLYAVRP